MNKEAFYKISYGLYLVCSKDGNNMDGHISNTVFQVTADPPKFVVASHKNNLTTSYIEKSKLFSVSILKQNVDLEFMSPWGFNSGRNMDKFKEANYKLGKTGVPIVIDKTVAYLECEVVDMIDTGTHILFVGKVVDAEILDKNSEVLTYAYYREVIKGFAPENSPTYVSRKPQEKKPEEEVMTAGKPAKYQCTVCGFIYDPEEGDPHSGIAPGTAFEDLPEDWSCPICGTSKKDFMMID